MKTINKVLLTTTLAFTAAANAMEYRLGPKIGFGIGTPTGVKGDETKVAFAPVIGLMNQFDFGTFGIDVGAYYRYNIFGFVEKEDTDGDGTKDTATSALGYSSIEIPVTAYYKLAVGPGAFKFGGGLGLDIGMGKVKVGYDEDNSNSADVDTSSSVSFSDARLKQIDLYAIAALGYQFDFESWALSIDFQPKYGLIDKSKDSASYGKWHTLWFDLGVGFLF